MKNTKIKITTKALQHMLKNIQSQKQGQKIFQIDIKPGGCHGLVYQMEYTEALEPKHQEQSFYYIYNDQPILKVSETAEAMAGDLEIDFAVSLMSGKFKFNNKKASSSCSCGEPFTLDDITAVFK